MVTKWSVTIKKRKSKLAFSFTVEPRYFEVPREMEKKFEIAGFRNNRGSVKFVTMNHFFNKVQYSMKKDTD